jgi:hypothetical protein
MPAVDLRTSLIKVPLPPPDGELMITKLPFILIGGQRSAVGSQ